jgi:hypothetical protein
MYIVSLSFSSPVRARAVIGPIAADARIGISEIDSGGFVPD